MTRKILPFIILILVASSNFQFVKAAGDLNIATPKINPVEGAAGQIYLPGANSPSNQGQILQQQLLPSVTTFVIGLTGGLSLLFVIVGGIQMLTAYGNDEMLGAGKKTITWALAGLVIALLSFAIVQIIISINLTPKT